MATCPFWNKHISQHEFCPRVTLWPDITNYVYDSTFDITTIIGLTTINAGLLFSPDGTRVYIASAHSSLYVVRLNLGIAWDITTLVWSSVSWTTATVTKNLDIHWNNDGSKLMMGFNLSKQARVLDLSGAYFVATGTDNGDFFSFSGQDNEPQGMCFKPDGTKMWMVGEDDDKVYEYSLSTAWDLSSASHISTSTAGWAIGAFMDLFIAPDGLSLYLVDVPGDYITQIDLLTAWDITSGVNSNKNISITAQMSLPDSITFKPDGSAFFVIDKLGTTIIKYVIP